MSAGREIGLAEAVAAVVRKVNDQGRAVGLAEVLGHLAGRTEPGDARPEAQGPPGQNAQDGPPPDLAGQVAAVLAALPGIASFPGLSGEPLFHDARMLSATYARIVDRRNAPLALLAEEVRLNSRDYPRPVPVELFEAPPFSLAPGDILAALKDMAGRPEFADIAWTTAPGGTVFLYSTRHLTPHYAQFLAERSEGLAANP